MQDNSIARRNEKGGKDKQISKNYIKKGSSKDRDFIRVNKGKPWVKKE